MSDETPRCDEVELHYRDMEHRDAPLYVVPAEFARQLERELRAAQTARDEYRKLASYIEGCHKETEAALAAAQQPLAGDALIDRARQYLDNVWTRNMAQRAVESEPIIKDLVAALSAERIAREAAQRERDALLDALVALDTLFDFRDWEPRSGPCKCEFDDVSELAVAADKATAAIDAARRLTDRGRK